VRRYGSANRCSLPGRGNNGELLMRAAVAASESFTSLVTIIQDGFVAAAYSRNIQASNGENGVCIL